MTDEEANKEPLLEQQPPAAAEGSTEIAPGITLNAAQLPLFIVFVASVVLLIATGAEYKWSFSSSYSGYALSISVIALVLSFFGLILTKVDDVYEKVGHQLTLLIFAYSFIGACFLTFDTPFHTSGNGFFAAWGICYGSALAMGMSSFQSGVRGLGAVMGLVASSLIVIIASIAPIRDGTNRSEAIYALVLACLTFLFLSISVKMGKAHGATYFLALAILAMCWIVEASLTTFRGPFNVTGNGYFGSWTGAFTACIASFAAMHEM